MDALNRKEAIIMGDDITPVTREEYCLKELAAGGGGSLDYVVPEQTVTFVKPLESVEAVVSNVNVDGLQENDQVIIKFIPEGSSPMYTNGYYDETGKVFSFEHFGKIKYIQNRNVWIWQLPNTQEGMVATVAIISGF